MKRITHLYYRHNERRVVDQDGATVSMKKAKKVLAAGGLTDFNLAIYTLSQFDFDVEKVEAHYTELEGSLE